jgi:hypothetical protein
MMINIKTYEGFFDVFRKSKNPKDITTALIEDLKNNVDSIKNDNNSTKKNSEISYAITIFKSNNIPSKLLLKDIFTIKISKGKDVTCKIRIDRIHKNFDLRSDIIELRGEKEGEHKIKTIEKTFNINQSQKIEQIIQQIKSDTHSLYEQFKIYAKSDEIISSIKNIDKLSDDSLMSEINKRLEIKKNREEYKKQLLKEFDIDNVESLILDLKDEFYDVTTRVFSRSGIRSNDEKIFFEISGSKHFEERNVGLKTRIKCNEFIERYRAEYGDKYKIDVQITDRFYIQFEIGDYPKELILDKRTIRRRVD